MKRKDMYTGAEREVKHYYVISKDLDPDANWAEKETFRFDIYEADPEAITTIYTRIGELKKKGIPHVIHSRGGLATAEIAEHLAMVEGLARGLDVKNVKDDRRADNVQTKSK